jgi:hypothetical protein
VKQIQQTSLFDFKPEKIQEKKSKEMEDKRVMDYLATLSAKQLMEDLRSNGGHPKPKWGDGETWRFYYLDECKRRGKQVLRDLGWPDDEEALYVNLYTGDVQTLIDIATTEGYFADRHTVANQVWSIIEHWEPYDPKKPNTYRIAYLEENISRLKHIKAKGKLDAYNRTGVKRIPDMEKEIENEKKKGE